MESIKDAQGFSSNTPITPSGGFSVETLTKVTPSWKTELDRSISAMEDRIPRRLQHCYKICCKKGGRYRRCTCMFGGNFTMRMYFQMGELAYNRLI